MSRCALVGAVDFNAAHFKAQHFDCVVAVDAGYAHLKSIEVIPDRVIGDFDSLGYIPDHPQVKRFPSQKDESDIELALKDVIEQGHDDLVVYGCLGGRLDFTYAIYQLIAGFSEAGKKIVAIGEDCAVTAIVGKKRSCLTFSEKAAGTFSLFAFSPCVEGVLETGFAYSLDQATLRSDTPLGISNEFTGAKAVVSVAQGTALVFCSLEGWRALVE